VSSFWSGLLGKLLGREDLTFQEASEAMRRILTAEATPAQVASFAVALRAKGETPDEAGGLAQAMLDLAPPVETPGPALDTTGTGGDGAGTMNVCTLAAVVAAGAGAIVAKHGNRAVSSRCGSADLLEALGVKIAASPEDVARCLADCGIGFMFAPVFHPALSQASGPRGEIGVPTVFDFLAPLTNPAGPASQLVGVPEERMQAVIAGVLAARGTRAYVVRGDDGVDEITTTGPTHLMETRGGVVMRRHLLPIEMGVQVARRTDLAGGDVERNVAIAKAVLGGEKGPPRDIVAVNAAAALTIAGLAEDFEEGLANSLESLDSGRAASALTKWVEASSRV